MTEHNARTKPTWFPNDWSTADKFGFVLGIIITALWGVIALGLMILALDIRTLGGVVAVEGLIAGCAIGVPGLCWWLWYDERYN